jgi:ATP-binding cassette subfamily C protein
VLNPYEVIYIYFNEKKSFCRFCSTYQIFDSVTFTYTPVNKSTAAKLYPVAYTLYRPFPDKKITVWDILQFTFRGHITDFVKILIGGLIPTLFGMLTPQFTGLLIDYAIPDAKRQLLIQMGLGLFAASFGMMIFQLGQSFVILKLQTQVSFDTQAAVWDRLLKLKPGFFRQYSTGDLQNRVSAISQIRNILSGSILRTIFTSIFSFLNLGLLIIYSFPLALVAIAIALVTIIVTTMSGIITRQKMRPLQELSGEVFGLTVQLIGGVSKLRVAAAESEAFTAWAKKYTQQIKLMLSTQLVEDSLRAFNVMLPEVSSMILFGLAVTLITHSQGQTGLSTGTFLAFNSAFGAFISSATRLSNTLMDVLEITILWERAQPILQTETEVDAHKYHPGKLAGEIKLDQVCFRYRQDSPLILDHITLSAKAGEFIDNQTQAIVTQSLEQLGVTRVIIAHRLSTIQNADRIYVLANGKIVQEGSFEQLASVKGLFADLMLRQMV